MNEEQIPEDQTPDSSEPGTPESPTTIMGKTAATYQWWNNLSTINAQDPILVSILKIGFRVLGILILIAISPLVILGVLFAFIGAG